MKLTNPIVDRLRPGPQDVFAWDGETHGFGVKCSPGGTRSFILVYKHQGRSRRYTLGRYGSPWTVDTARTEARRLLGQVAQGLDPAGTKRAWTQAPTVQDVVERYLREHVDVKLKRPKEARRLLTALILPKMGSRRIDAIKPADIAALHHALRETPYQANRVLAVLSKMFTLTERWGLRPPGSNPCRGLEKFTERARRRYLSPEELARLGATLDLAERDGGLELNEKTRSIDVHAIAAIRLLLYTGARVQEILGLKWTDVDAALGVGHLRDSKTGAKDIQLNEAAVAVLQNLPRVGSYVIAGRGDRKRFDIKGPARAIFEHAKIENVRVHDLRHTFASVAVSGGMSLPLVGGLLGHRSTATTQRYAHLAADPLKAAAEQIGDTIAAAMGGK